MKKRTAYVLAAIVLTILLITLGSAADIFIYAGSQAAQKSGSSKQSTSQRVSGDRKCPCTTCKPTAGEGTRWGDCYCRIQKKLSQCSYYCRNGKLSYVRNCQWKS